MVEKSKDLISIRTPVSKPCGVCHRSDQTKSIGDADLFLLIGAVAIGDLWFLFTIRTNSTLDINTYNVWSLHWIVFWNDEPLLSVYESQRHQIDKAIRPMNEYEFRDYDEYYYWATLFGFTN